MRNQFHLSFFAQQSITPLDIRTLSMNQFLNSFGLICALPRIEKERKKKKKAKEI